MKEYYLVTTALEETWPDGNQPVLFLGEWCRLYSRKHRWEKMGAEVLGYPWDDRDKLYQDYQYLGDLFEQFLINLSSELNKIHGVDHTLRYWRILIGPWLINFLPIVFDRWSCLEKAISLYPLKGIIALDNEYIDNIPVDMHHFTSLQEEDQWNEFLYFSILKLLGFNKFTIKKESKLNELETLDTDGVKEGSKNGRSVLSRLKESAINLSSYFASRNNYFILNPYLSRRDNVELQLKLFQFPARYPDERCDKVNPSISFRKWQLPSSEDDTVFERIVKELIPLQIPQTYLEGYDKLCSKTSNLGWTKKPKLIWTSNSYYLDDIFKMWAAERVEEGVPLVIGQHGGHYGQGLFSFPEYHELMISDRYLSWGWENADDKVVPVGIFKRSNLQKKKKVSKNRILLLISGAPRYSGTIISMPMAGQVNKYLDDQFEFYRNLSDPVSANVIIRLYPHDYEWSQYDRWKDTFPNSKIDNGEDTFDKALVSSDLVIAGWNTTTYLESMSSGIPTVIFWNPEYFELREEASVLFKDLKKVGIYHTNPVDAANHVIKIWGDIKGWWNLPDVVAAREEFLNKYALSCDHLTDKLRSVLKSVS
jgi:putative transferase (TIGR04331 family)